MILSLEQLTRIYLIHYLAGTYATAFCDKNSGGIAAAINLCNKDFDPPTSSFVHPLHKTGPPTRRYITNHDWFVFVVINCVLQWVI